MIRSVVDSAVYAAGIRYLYDNPAGVMSWNTGIDYRRYYADADHDQQRIVRDLYARAGLTCPAGTTGRTSRDERRGAQRVSREPRSRRTLLP